MREQRGPEDILISKEKGPGRIDSKICKLQELKEKELALKDNYSLFDEIFCASYVCLTECLVLDIMPVPSVISTVSPRILEIS